MCGIFGSINLSLASQSHKIFEGLAHRGPNERGFFFKDNIELFHTRLAIQDLTITGKQPMHHKQFSIVFNGEVYNHLALRKKYNLQAYSNSDTKTVLMLFELLGMKMLDELDGMFAFAIYDQIKHKLYLVKDRAGKKPLYLYQNAKEFVFSSELNVLNKLIQPNIALDELSSYLYLGYHYRKSTPFKNVKEIENGHYFVIDTLTGTIEDLEWFSMQKCYQNKLKISYHDAINSLDEKLKNAIHSRIDSSDLDVGSFLSGGIDSGIITAIAARHHANLKTFTVKIEGSYDESGLAQMVAQKYQTKHTLVNISFDDLQSDIEKILVNYGEPYCDSSAIPSYYVAKAAKEHVTVVLNGDGADELFGGYRRYVPFRYFDFFNSSKVVKLASHILTDILPEANEKKSNYNYVYRLLKFASHKDILQQYSSASSDMFVGYENHFLMKPNLKEIYRDLNNINQLKLTSLDKMLLMDFQSILFSGLLPKMDIATMANSLEGRSPFLAKEILEFAPSLPDNFKINGLRTKSILRDLAKKYLPEALINQPKRGFEIPLKNWVDHQLKDIIFDYLLSSKALYPSIIQKKFIVNLLEKKIKISDERRAKMLFNVFAMEVWHQNLKQSSIASFNSKNALVLS